MPQLSTKRRQTSLAIVRTNSRRERHSSLDEAATHGQILTFQSDTEARVKISSHQKKVLKKSSLAPSSKKSIWISSRTKT